MRPGSLNCRGRGFDHCSVVVVCYEWCLLDCGLFCFVMFLGILVSGMVSCHDLRLLQLLL